MNNGESDKIQLKLARAHMKLQSLSNMIYEKVKMIKSSITKAIRERIKKFEESVIKINLKLMFHWK
jgi:hypothetical protein